MTTPAPPSTRFHDALLAIVRSRDEDLETALRTLMRVDAETLGVERVSAWFFEDDGSDLVCRTLFTLSDRAYTAGARLEAEALPRYFATLRERRVIAAHAAATDAATAEFATDYLIPLGITSMLDVPIWKRGAMVGVVCHEHVGPQRLWTAEEQDFATSIADMVTLALASDERDAAERALRTSEASYRAIFDAASEGIYVHDLATGAILDANPRACATHGLTIDELRELGPNVLGTGIPPYTAEAALAHIEAARRAPQRFEWQVRHRDGQLAWLEVNLQRVVIDGQDRLLAMTRDIDDRKEAAEALQRSYDELERRVEERTAELAAANAALRKSEDHFRRILENASDIVAILDEQGTIRYQSRAMERVLGWKVEEIVGQSAFIHFHPDDVAPALEALGRIVAHPAEPQSAIFRFRHKDGGYRTLEALGRALSPDSTRDGIVVNSRDITGRIEAEEALRRAKEDADRAREAAEAANRAKSDFLSRMSHELRTPMNSILGFGQLLARKELPADQRKAVDHIMKAGQHLLNLINEVLDIARIEANRQHLSPEPVRVRTALQEALSLIRPLAAQHGTDVTADVDVDGEVYVHADRQRLAQVLLNLLANAVKYNVPGGRVWLTCEERGERLRLTVHDTGHGIAPERVNDLFTPFARLGAERTDVEGTGLGLALSKRLIEAMNGAIGVTSDPGIGSKFWIELDRVDSPVQRVIRAGDMPFAEHPAARDRRDATILYIEDNLANLSLVEAILADEPGIKLLPALQGQIGIDLAVQHHPDLILLDMNLPDMPGFDVLQRLRSDPSTHTTPVIVISADATPGNILRARHAGARGYLTKPIDVDEFLQALGEALR